MVVPLKLQVFFYIFWDFWGENHIIVFRCSGSRKLSPTIPIISLSCLYTAIPIKRTKKHVFPSLLCYELVTKIPIALWSLWGSLSLPFPCDVRWRMPACGVCQHAPKPLPRRLSRLLKVQLKWEFLNMYCRYIKNMWTEDMNFAHPW